MKAASEVFRGKYMEELKLLCGQGRLSFYGAAGKYRGHYEFKELLRRCYSKGWVVYCKKTFRGAQPVISYLGKYTHRIAISNRRILRMDGTTVTFSVKDYRQGGRWKDLTLPGVEFIRRFLMHVPPKGFVRVRHYGLLSSRSKKKNLALCRNLLGCRQYLSELEDMDTAQMVEHLWGIKICVCRHCGGRLAGHHRVAPGQRRDPMLC